MAFSDVTDGSRIIQSGEGAVKITLAGACKPGDLLGYSSGWKQADGNSSIYAELVAGQSGASGDEITAYRVARVSGFTGGTAGGTLYLSDTAGGYASSAGTVSQKAGMLMSATDGLICPAAVFQTLAEGVALADLEDVASARIIVGNGSNRPTAVAVSGDATIDNAGAVAIGATKVTKAMHNDDAVYDETLCFYAPAAGATVKAKVRKAGTVTQVVYLTDAALDAGESITVQNGGAAGGGSDAICASTAALNGLEAEDTLDPTQKVIDAGDFINVVVPAQTGSANSWVFVTVTHKLNAM